MNDDMPLPAVVTGVPPRSSRSGDQWPTHKYRARKRAQLAAYKRRMRGRK